MLLKHLPAQGHMILVRQHAGAERLEIDLVHAHILFKKPDIPLQLFPVRMRRRLRHKVIHQFKIPIVPHDAVPPDKS